MIQDISNFPPVEFLQSDIDYFELIGANFLCIQT